jgi:peroxiredoxin family protein
MTQTATTPTLTAVPDAEPQRKLAIICSKGSLDMAYPGLILANAARMAGTEAMIFFTFWGLDIVNESKVDKLHVSTVGNPSMPVPTMLGGLPGMEAFASSRMKKEMTQLEIPTVREMVEMLDDAGTDLYACQLAMDMFKLEKSDLMPQVKDVISAMDFIDLTEGAQIVFV